MRGGVVLAFAALAAGCLGDMLMQRARETAARDHGCPLDRVWIAADATDGDDAAYSVSVCGTRRMYRLRRSPDVGLGDGQFREDQPAQSAPPPPVRAAAPAPAVPRGARIDRHAASGGRRASVTFVFDTGDRIVSLDAPTEVEGRPILSFAARVTRPPAARCESITALVGTALRTFPAELARVELIDGGALIAVSAGIGPVDAAELANAPSIGFQLCDGGPAVTLPPGAIDTLAAWHREWSASRQAQ